MKTHKPTRLAEPVVGNRVLVKFAKGQPDAPPLAVQKIRNDNAPVVYLPGTIRVVRKASWGSLRAGVEFDEFVGGHCLITTSSEYGFGTVTNSKDGRGWWVNAEFVFSADQGADATEPPGHIVDDAIVSAIEMYLGQASQPSEIRNQREMENE